jgi:hypothetical protein
MTKKKKKYLSHMSYREFTDSLKIRGVGYIELNGIDIDFWMCTYVGVIPRRENMKVRYFKRDTGEQLNILL